MKPRLAVITFMWSKMKKANVSIRAAVVAVLFLLVAAVGVILVLRSPRPILAVTTYRECDFIDMAGTVRVVCTDGTMWTVTRDVVPIPRLPAATIPSENPGQTLGETILIRYSHYWPPLGGVNCGNFVGGICVSKMASNKPWADYIGEAVACPKEMPFGTLIVLDGRVWTCLDRGGMIKYVDGVPWLDFLMEKGAHTYGEIIPVQIIPA
jgi:hypothetical protein